MSVRIEPRSVPIATYSVSRSSRPRTMALSDVKERRFLARVWLGFSFLAAAVGVFNVVVRLRVADLGYRIEATHRAIERLELERRELQVRAARAEDARRLEQLAKSRLGLGPASASQRMVVP